MSEGRITAPRSIEERSFQIIGAEWGQRDFAPQVEPIVKRVIHATADFSFADSLTFSPGAVQHVLDVLAAGGATIVTDATMALAGISKPALAQLGCSCACFIAEPDVAERARATGATRSRVSMDKAATLAGPLIFAIGNAPTALLRVCELIDEGMLAPELVIGVPVGFVNVVESKEELLARDVSSIVARGRKGGSTVAAAIVNALLYQLTRDAGGQGARR